LLLSSSSPTQARLESFAACFAFSSRRLGLENALKYGFRPVRLLSGLTIGNPNIPLALCYPVMMLLMLMSLVTEMVAYCFMLIESKVG
jgi:hypothetical protein